MAGDTDVRLCAFFATLSIVLSWGVVYILATGKVVPGNALNKVAELAIKEVFGDPKGYR